MQRGDAPHTLKDVPLLSRNQWMSVNPKNQQRNWSDSTWMRILVMTLHCPWTWQPSWRGALPKSGITIQAPLFPWPWIPHHCLMKMATSTDPHTQEELAWRSLSSSQPLLNLNWSPSLGRCLTHWTTLMPGSGHRGTGRDPQCWKDPPPILCNIHPHQTQSLGPFLAAGCSHQAAPGPTRGIRLVGGPTTSDQITSPRLSAPHWFPQNEGFPDH